ncbi:polynucleotide adenylyltransferase PcnB [Neisseriaceae bacterium CLB008]|nr:polynucleotide adenylyltransferase PcnB [Neisseriaceae bacterium]
MIKKWMKKLFNQKVQAGKRAPDVLPYGSHKIARDSLSFAAEKVIKRLQAEGYEAFVVGGAVRDLLLGIEPKDFDVATNAKPEEVHKVFRRSRIIGRRFKIVHVMVGPETIEVTTFRGGDVQTQNEQGRIMKDNTYGTQMEDALRRDFTCNALYYNPKTQEILDYHDGVADIKAKRLVMIGDPAERYKEDPVRIMRAARLSAKLGFTLAPKTQAPIAAQASLLAQEPPARLFDELLKLLFSGNAQACLKRLDELGVQRDVFPLLQAVLGQDENNPFVTIALESTDQRLREQKPVSVGFLLASLLWQPVYEKWQAYLAEGQKSVPALAAAMADVQDSLDHRFSVPRRFSATMREIWLMQPQFEARVGNRPFRLLAQNRFRAAYDFLLIRAQVGEVPQELADWWTQFQKANGDEQVQMIKDAPNGQTRAAAPKRRRRKPSGAQKSATRGAPQQAGQRHD